MVRGRMISHEIYASEGFVSMSHSARNLYTYLVLHGDDDGFLMVPNSLIEIYRCDINDLKVLEENKYIIIFESSVIAITHWKTLNPIEKKKYYKPTVYQYERKQLIFNEKTRRYELKRSRDEGSSSISALYDNKEHSAKENEMNQSELKESKELKELNEFKENKSAPVRAHEHDEAQIIGCGKYKNVHLTNDQMYKVVILNGQKVLEDLSEEIYQTGECYDDHYQIILDRLGHKGNPSCDDFFPF